MNKHPYDKNIVARVAINLLPPSVRESLLSDSGFQNDYNISMDYKIDINEINLSVQRSSFYNIIRNLISEKSSKQIFTDKHGRDWSLELLDNNDESKIFLSHGGNRLYFNDFSAFSQDSIIRLNGLQINKSKFNLPDENFNKWHEILSQRPLTDDEIDDYHFDIKDTPVHVSDFIDSEIKHVKSNISSLIPKSERYFYRLVGNSKHYSNILEYSRNVLDNHINQLISWKPFEGFLLALLLSHPQTNSLINVSQLSQEELIQAYKWIQTQGDYITKLRAVEIGLSTIDKYPKLISYIKNIIEEILNDDPEDMNSRFRLLSSLIVHVDGDLSRTKLFNAKPPYWRRLASIAHASIIERGVIGSNVDIQKFEEIIINLSGHHFYFQNTIDLRLEPRWHPDFMSPAQLKHMFLFRIANAANENISLVKSSSLYKLIFDENSDPKQSFISFPLSFLPGPLEGGLTSQIEPTHEQLEQVEEKLESEVLEKNTINLIGYTSLIFNIDSHLVELVAKAIKKTKYYITRLDSSETLFLTLRELSIAAAVTRSKELSEEIKVMARKYRYNSELKMSKEKDMLIGLIAAASHSDTKEWCEFIGDWVTELAFQNLSFEEINILHEFIIRMCHIEPQLWQTCSRAKAALSSCLANV